MKTKQGLAEEIEIPEGISADISGKEIVIKSEKGEIRRKLNPLVNLKIEGKKIIMSCKRSTKKEKKMFGTMKAHIKNMINGFNKSFRYKLQVAAVHFPVTVTHDKNTSEIVIKNFLGEKKDRRVKVLDNVDVKINKDVIEIESFDIEKAGQVATNLEKGTKVRNKDRRVFQDGIFLVEKPGRTYS